MICKGNHVKFARFVLFAVSEEAQAWVFFCFVQCIIKQLLDSVFAISRIIKVLVRVISLSLRLRLITPTLTLIILDITKTSSNNCLLSSILSLPNLPLQGDIYIISAVMTYLLEESRRKPQFAKVKIDSSITFALVLVTDAHLRL